MNQELWEGLCASLASHVCSAWLEQGHGKPVRRKKLPVWLRKAKVSPKLGTWCYLLLPRTKIRCATLPPAVRKCPLCWFLVCLCGVRLCPMHSSFFPKAARRLGPKWMHPECSVCHSNSVLCRGEPHHASPVIKAAKRAQLCYQTSENLICTGQGAETKSHNFCCS